MYSCICCLGPAGCALAAAVGPLAAPLWAHLCGPRCRVCGVPRAAECWLVCAWRRSAVETTEPKAGGSSVLGPSGTACAHSVRTVYCGYTLYMDLLCSFLAFTLVCLKFIRSPGRITLSYFR